MATTKAATNREIKVLNRYSIKQDCPEKGLHKGDVVLHIRNDKGAEYYTTLRRNKAHSCSCPAGEHSRKCYHVSVLVSKENARIEARLAAKKVIPMVAPTVASQEIGERGTLTRSQGFSLKLVS